MKDRSRRTGTRTIAAAAAATLGLALSLMFGAGPASAVPACPTEPSNGVCIPAQGGMEGNLQMAPGSTLWAGYNFATGAGATSMTVTDGIVYFDLSCSGNTTPNPSVLSITFPQQTYASPFPTSQSDPATFQGSTTVPDACNGANVHVGVPDAGPFSATFWGNGSGSFNVQFHYHQNNTSGASWSASKSVTAGPLSGAAQAPILGSWEWFGIGIAFVVGAFAVLVLMRRFRGAPATAA